MLVYLLSFSISLREFRGKKLIAQDRPAVLRILSLIPNLMVEKYSRSHMETWGKVKMSFDHFLAAFDGFFPHFTFVQQIYNLLIQFFL